MPIVTFNQEPVEVILARRNGDKFLHTRVFVPGSPVDIFQRIHAILDNHVLEPRQSFNSIFVIVANKDAYDHYHFGGWKVYQRGYDLKPEHQPYIVDKNDYYLNSFVDKDGEGTLEIMTQIYICLPAVE